MTSEHDIIVVDDHPLFRRGVIQLLKMDPSFNVVAEAGDFEAAMVAVRERDPDIVLLDLNMKHTSGVEILTAIKAFDPSIRVIMLTVSDSPSDLLQCFQNGANGYLLKDQEPEQILEDIQKAAKGLHESSPGRMLKRRVLQQRAPPLRTHGAGEECLKAHCSGQN